MHPAGIVLQSDAACVQDAMIVDDQKVARLPVDLHLVPILNAISHQAAKMSGLSGHGLHAVHVVPDGESVEFASCKCL